MERGASGGGEVDRPASVGRSLLVLGHALSTTMNSLLALLVLGQNINWYYAAVLIIGRITRRARPSVCLSVRLSHKGSQLKKKKAQKRQNYCQRPSGQH